MRVLFVGDVFATPGMKAARSYLDRVRPDYDFVIVNGENAAGGRGITRKHYQQLRAAGADVVTLGNHTFDQPEVHGLLEETQHLLRPMNYPPGTPGLGAATFTAADGSRITVAQVMGRVFMDPLDDPFRALDDLIDRCPAGEALVLDLHAEATSEKKVLLHHVAGRVSAAIGSHTHVQTADETVVNGTAYITDVGMTGVQHSAIGMAYEEVHHRFTRKTPKRFRPAEGPATVCAVSFVLDGARARSVERLRWTAEQAAQDEAR
ncbi:MAG: TIGR00282 family metallophosphoesterase [Trueperaceae bacterium]|nr:TIGR00282 family metallophosphoesterase [Trueperaceae bacterium]